MERITGALWVSCAAMVAAALGMSQGAPTAQGGSNPGNGKDLASGPVRLARVSFAQGDVSWRPDDTSAWSSATINLPLQQGAELWVKGGGLAELQFDDGSDLRLGNDAVATLQSLYSDSQGEFTEVKLNAGTSGFDLKGKYSIYQVDTPFDSVKAAGPAKFRVDVGSSDSVSVSTGSATLSSASGDTTLRSGDFVALSSPQDSVNVQDLPDEDAFDRFDAERDAAFAGSTEHLPPNIGLVAGDLDNYGSWHHEAKDGWVWAPNEDSAWRPYSDGQWVSNDSFGWTWDGNEPWGWAPYHYGTWGHYGFGWGWNPGPYNQYWSPAVVDFSLYNGNYCWTPLCPGEVVYPGAFGCGFGLSDWWLNFSIGCCGVYQPGFGGFCNAIAFGGGDWGRGGFGRDGFGGRGFGDRGGELGLGGRNGFVPRNSAFGATTVGQNGFGQRGGFRNVNGNAGQMFSRGQSVTSGSRAYSGPVGARVNGTSMTPTHTLGSSQRPGALNQALYRAPVSSGVARTSQPFGRTTNVGGQAASANRSGSFNPASRGTAGSSSTVNSGGRAMLGTNGLSQGSASNMSAVARARQSLGYSGSGYSGGRSSSPLGAGGRNSFAGNSVSGSSAENSSAVGGGSARASQGASGLGQRSSSGMSAVQRARQSLGYSGSGYSQSRSPSGNAGGGRSAMGGNSGSRSSVGNSSNFSRGGSSSPGAAGYGQRSSAGLSSVAQARRSLGYSGSGYSGSRGSSSNSGGSSYRGGGRGAYGNSGAATRGSSGFSGYRGSSQVNGYRGNGGGGGSYTGSSRGSSSGSRSYGGGSRGGGSRGGGGGGRGR